MNSNHKTILVPELLQHARRFGKHAYVTNEQLYELIKELNPNYSLTKLYYDLVSWHSNYNRMKKFIDAEVLEFTSTLDEGGIYVSDGYQNTYIYGIVLPNRFDRFQCNQDDVLLQRNLNNSIIYRLR